MTDFLRKEKISLTDTVRSSEPVSRIQMLKLAVSLSIPAIVAQISAIIMQYIDAAMVGSLGAAPAASIGLVSTTTWIFFGLCSAAAVGFSVQVAHLLGSGRTDSARQVFRQSLVATFIFSTLLAIIGIAISGSLPRWLGGDPEINPGASLYFLIVLAAMPMFQYSYLAGGMLRCSGNMLFPGIMGVLMCVMDIAFNFFLIFPTREIAFGGTSVTVPGAGLGIAGAAIGTAMAEAICTVFMLVKLIFGNSELRLWRRKGSFRLRGECMKRAFHIGAPMGAERFLTCGAQVMLTTIVAPLGAFSIAANSFAVTAESLCYMPGYGISDASTTLVGQSLGAGRRQLARQFAYTCVAMGMVVMSVLAVVMYVFAPEIIGVMTPVPEILDLGVMSLRIEAWAEPMFAASIVCYGVFVGAGDTIVPSCFNLGCIWGVRVTLAAILAPTMGLAGVWIAMAIELTVRGILFLIRLFSKAWFKRIDKLKLTI